MTDRPSVPWLWIWRPVPVLAGGWRPAPPVHCCYKFSPLHLACRARPRPSGRAPLWSRPAGARPPSPSRRQLTLSQLFCAAGRLIEFAFNDKLQPISGQSGGSVGAPSPSPIGGARTHQLGCHWPGQLVAHCPAGRRVNNWAAVPFWLLWRSNLLA